MWKKYIGILGVALLIVIVGYQVSFLHTMKQHYDNASDQMEEASTSTDDAVLTGSGSDKVLKSTRIVVESYDKEGSMTDRQEYPANAEFIGNNRLDMLVYANAYREEAPEQEKKAGLERMVLESFSSDTVTLVKYYGEPEEEQGYFIGIKDNVVIVYLRDRSQVYEYTNIELWSLPVELQYDLVEGIYVDSEKELFDFLQTYSS